MSRGEFQLRMGLTLEKRQALEEFLPWFADGPLLASSPRRKSSGVSKAIAIWALSFTRLEANRNLLTAMSLLPKSIHRCRRYPTKFNSGRDIPSPSLPAG